MLKKIFSILTALALVLSQAAPLLAASSAWVARKTAGDHYLQAGDTGAAISEYKKALALHPESPETYFNLAIACYAARDLESAISALEKLLTLQPQDTEAHYNLGCFYLYDGQTEKAKQSFRKAESSAGKLSPFLDLSKRGLEFTESLDDSPSQGLILYLLQFNLATALPLQGTDKRLRS